MSAIISKSIENGQATFLSESAIFPYALTLKSVKRIEDGFKQLLEGVEIILKIIKQQETN
jgi:hypothetical protein